MPSAPILGHGDTVQLDAEAFGAAFNGPLVHECVIAELAARRRGTHATKTRGMVRGGGAKPWRQKGTGRARAGTSRSPLWTGGGTVFGPSPRHYTVKVNRKARRAALRSALSLHAGRGSIAVVDADSFQVPSTKRAVEVLGDLAGSRILIALGDEDVAAAKSFRNLDRVDVLSGENVGIVDIVRTSRLVVSLAALAALTDRARKTDRRGRTRVPAAVSAGPTGGG